MEITRREFINLTAGAVAFTMLPNIAVGGKKMASDLVIKNVQVLKPSGEVETANIFISGDQR